MRVNNFDSIGSTAKGIMIGIFSVLGAAGVVLIISAIVYYFRYTQQGRIFLDRISRPGEYDDEQQFAKEEAEALEEMDDIQRTEYMRAKGRVDIHTYGTHHTDSSQLLSKPTRLNPYRPTSPYLNSWQSKRRVFLPGNLSLNLKLQTALLKDVLRLNSSTRNAVCKATFPYQSRTRFITGKPRSTISPKPQILPLV